MTRTITAMIVLTASIIFTAPICAQTTVRLEARTMYVNGAERPSFGANSYAARPITPALGVSAWFQVEEKWSEAYGGFTFAPMKWLELGASVGMEQSESPWRISGSVWLGKGSFTSLTIIENGGSGFWYQSTDTLAVADWMKIGVAATRFKGIGPCVQVTFDKFTLWTNGYFFDPEKLNAEPSLMTGLSVSY